MDQDAFRQMLSLSGSNNTAGQTRQPQVTFPGRRKPIQKESESSSVSSFKPRNHQHTGEKYRDRATERRGGVNDYADVEQVMVNFEKANAEEDARLIEERRKMLGGDEKHTVLVKGLDFALLEQQKSKLNRTQEIQDEVLLEQAFKEAAAPRKKTREEIVEELKKSRSGPSSIPPPDKSLEVAKSTGKFRPIGAPVESKVKKRKNKTGADDPEKKSKKRKTEDTSNNEQAAAKTVSDSKPVVDDRTVRTIVKDMRPRTPSPDVDVDVDIFADVGEYRGFGSDSGSDGETDEGDAVKRDHAASNSPPAAMEGRKMDWFGNPITEKEQKTTEGPATTAALKGKGKELLPSREPDQEDSDMEPGHLPQPEPEQLTRLRPLASSSVPSIRDILAMDEAAEREEKRKAKKEKKKNKKPSETTKIDREVKQLEQYVATKDK